MGVRRVLLTCLSLFGAAALSGTEAASEHVGPGTNIPPIASSINAVQGEPDDSGAAPDVSPQATALELEKALIDSGVDAEEARAIATDFLEHSPSPPDPADDEANGAPAGT